MFVGGVAPRTLRPLRLISPRHYCIPKEEGAIEDGHLLGELGQVLLGAIPGREGPDDVTVFKSLGIAMEDVAAAHHVYQRAKDGGGRWCMAPGFAT